MPVRPRLALFDCDGTLADSQHHILSAMREAFADIGLPAPPAQAIRATIGLSLPGIAAHLLPDAEEAAQTALVDAYRARYFAARTAAGAAPEPLYDGMADVIGGLADAGWLLGIATGKSMRGLVRLLAAHGLSERFVTLQTADHHPSKPHPSMCLAALDETGCAAQDTIVIGDTAYDIAMARAAGALAVGVAWGYHRSDDLVEAGAHAVADHPDQLAALMDSVLERS
jgi:phosphoglycolate phosphatase